MRAVQKSALSLIAVSVVALGFQASHYSTPAGTRPAVRRAGVTILPGGRFIAPVGRELITGPGAFGLAVSAAGRIATANLGPERLSVTTMELDKKGPWLVHNLLTSRAGKSSESHNAEDEKEWHSVFMGIAFQGEKMAWVAEGNSGRVRLVDLATGERRRVFNLNYGSFADSFTADLAFDSERGILYVTDQGNFRVVALDTRKNRILSSTRVGRLPFAVALSEDKRALYVTHVGVFEYHAIAELRWPAFGFPSPEATAGLGDPNVREANSLAILNVQDAAAPKVETFVRTGLPFGPQTPGGSSPSGVAAGAGLIFVSNAHNDSITFINAKTQQVTGEVELRIPGLGALRGVMPLGMEYDAASGWLLVAEAGINAVGVVDVKERRLVGHVPVGWFPTRVAVREGMVYTSNAKGHGTGPKLPGHYVSIENDELMEVLHRGTVSIFPLPNLEELKKHSATVLNANGFLAVEGAPSALPREIEHVVLIVKENRTYDEVFGDIQNAANGPVAGARGLARFGVTGLADGGRDRLSLHRVNVTPNHHALAAQFCFADNFYADSEVSVDGHHWLVGNYPDAWTESSLMAAYAGQKDFRFPTAAPGRLLFAGSDSSVHPEEIDEAGTIWHHLERHKISFRNFGEGFELAGVDEGPGLKPTGGRFRTNIPMPDPLYRNSSREYPGFNMNIPDQFRATQLIHELDEMFAKTGKPLPQFLYIHLPNDHITKPRAEDGYPYPASYVADNDYALGRIVEYFSHSPWWRNMAIFVTEDDAQGGSDHIDSHRTVLLGIGPWFKKRYAVHTNTSFPGLLKTIFRLLDLPPLNLFDASAADLSDAFTSTPDFGAYRVIGEDPRLFIPERAREPLDPKPSVKMDQPEK